MQSECNEIGMLNTVDEGILTSIIMTMMTKNEYESALRIDLKQAEEKAWKALKGYKFVMFGYWAGVWVHLNRVGNFREPNPWADLVDTARMVVTGRR